MNMQSPQASKINQADIVIFNNGSLESLYAQLDRVWTEVLQRHKLGLEDAAGRAGR